MIMKILYSQDHNQINSSDLFFLPWIGINKTYQYREKKNYDEFSH